MDFRVETKVAAALFVVAAVVAVAIAQAPPPPGPPMAATGAVGILVNGLPIAAEPNVNFQSGNGILETAQDNPANHRVDIMPNTNSVFSATVDQVHHTPNFCDSTNGTKLYTCKMPTRALSSLRRGDSFLLAVDATCMPTCSLSIDGLQPPTTILQADGVTSPNGALIAGEAKWIWYDGEVFRLP
jgi:hypothetical protein